MKAIDTEYNGYLFRSRTEARWAVFFDAMKIKYEYEKEGYEFEDGTRYLPDFWLPDYSLFIEVKGCKPTNEEAEKAKKLSSESGFPVLIFPGPPWQIDGCIHIKTEKKEIQGLLVVFVSWLIRSDRKEMDEAKQARFEFGAQS